MSQSSKIALFIVVSLIAMALLGYGYCASQKLDGEKITDVNSNIKDHIYDEANDTIDDEDDELEDLYEADVVDEDKDFEVYEEKDTWKDSDTNTEIPNSETSVANSDDTPREEIKQETVETPPVEFENRKYSVIVGSFKSKRNANKKLKALEENGFSGEIVQLKGSTLQSVSAGQFDSERDAEGLAKQIEEKGLRAIVRKN